MLAPAFSAGAESVAKAVSPAACAIICVRDSQVRALAQPYLFPYLGYLQLIAAVDQFVLHDDVQYIHQGWVNRNRILIAGKA